MTLTQVWGSLIIFIFCPLLGGLPVIAWITYGLTGRQLAKIGTGNISVSAAFYHGGRLAGILAVVSEALKGIIAVLLAKAFFPEDPAWELISLIALVMGRYWVSKGAGTTNVVWGYIVHDPIAAGLIFLIGGIGFTLLRERRYGRIGILVLLVVITTARHLDDPARIIAAIALSGILAWIYTKIPDDLDLPAETGQTNSQATFRFFRGDRALISIKQVLDPAKVGQKAATLSQLKVWGYPVPMGWVLPPGDDPEPLLNYLEPSEQIPLAVRSSAVGEDSELASAAGQYESILNVTDRNALHQAIIRCLASYDQPTAVQYRQDQGLADDLIAVLIQIQVRGVFSGVAFSRDPIARHGDAVVIEALPGEAKQVVSGQATPENYRVLIADATLSQLDLTATSSWVLPDDLTFEVEGEGEIPARLIQQVAFLARHLEARFHGIPQDIEWSYDGQTLWLLQARPITTLLPIWTRKIAAEVIPGVIRPLTWSVNRPLTCGVWGEIFTLVLGDRARGLDFNETATLHYARAYFNASLLGQLFRRMGLPPESLEFLTRGAKFTKPPLGSTLKNLPGLLRLMGREWRLEQDFHYDQRHSFAPALTNLADPSDLSTADLLARINVILDLLKKATYYSILAPLSAALRQAVLQVKDVELDNSQTPEIAALRSLQDLADNTRPLLAQQRISDSSALFATLANTGNGQAILQQFERFLVRYGYLSEVATDIAVPRWQEDPGPVRELFTQFCNPADDAKAPVGAELSAQTQPKRQNWKVQQAQRRVNLKGQVTAIYSQLLAELRWSFVALEKIWLQSGLLLQPGDIFFLELDEIRQLVGAASSTLSAQISQRVAQRRSQLERDSELANVPALVYGNAPPAPHLVTSTWQPSRQFQGIGASPGQAEGEIKLLRNLQSAPEVNRETILVVPYTDSGWAPLLARAGGLISEVGGRLSHGAIVAREYGIPAVMDIHNATQQLQDGQRVRIDGQRGTVEIL